VSAAVEQDLLRTLGRWAAACVTLGAALSASPLAAGTARSLR
jgi:hypothetical protein